MDALLQAVVDGVLVGMVYAVVAASFNILYRASKIPNIAQGQLLLVGACLVWTLSLWLPIWFAVIGAMLGTAVIGIVIQGLIFRPLRGQSILAIAAATIALMGVLRGATLAIWGTDYRQFPVVFPAELIRLGPLVINQGLLYASASALIGILLATLFFNRARLGLAMTAVAEDHVVAASLGIPLNISMTAGWVGSGVFTVLAAIALLNGQTLGPSVDEIGLRALPAALAAGLESIGFIPVAAIAIGLAEIIAQRYLDVHVGGLASIMVPYLILIVIVLVRPQGLFGWKVIERV